MGRKSTTGGVTPIGRHRIQFDFVIDGVRYRPTHRLIPHESNLRRAREQLARIKMRIDAGTFRFTEEFPTYRGRHTLRIPLRAQTCSDVFDAFLDGIRYRPTLRWIPHEANLRRAREQRSCGDRSRFAILLRTVRGASRCQGRAKNRAWRAAAPPAGVS